ncbi:MAG: hypothetical protein DFNUSKGM_003301 [Candidatus Fervidibacter sacchari]
MPTPSWSEVEALGSVIAKAIRAAAGSKIHREVWDDLLLEGKIAAYKALENHDPSKMDKETWVYQAVVKHIKRVLNQYLPAGKSLFEVPEENWLVFPKSHDKSSHSPLAIAVLLSLAPPLERLYVLHELLGWEKPPRYCKTRLKKRWENCQWVRLLTGSARNRDERLKLLRELCQNAQHGDEKEKEIAGFALVVVSGNELSEEEIALVKLAAQTLVHSPDPIHQFAGLWIFCQLSPEAWDEKWIDLLDVNTLGAVLESRYAKPKECHCVSPLCLHFYPDNPQRSPPDQVAGAVLEAMRRYAQILSEHPQWNARWRGRLMAKALGLYLRNSQSSVSNFVTSSGRSAKLLESIALARFDPKQGLEHATEWLPKASTLVERLWKALRSPDPLERSSALYAARGLAEDDRKILARMGLSDPLVFTRFSVLRTLGEEGDYEALMRELLLPHEHKRLLHRCILNTLARMDLERTLEIAKLVYLGEGKEAWREDTWMRHDAGYILLEGVFKAGRTELLEVFRQILAKEPHPSPFALLPAVQALF